MPRFITVIRLWVAQQFPGLNDLLLRPEEKLKLSIFELRYHFRALGYPIDDMTDQQILDGMYTLAKVLKESGVTVQQAADSFKSINHPPSIGTYGQV